MGVYPEPALCVDDVCRLVPGTSNNVEYFDKAHTRALRGKASLAAIKRHLIATLALGVALGTGVTAAAAAQRIDAVAASQVRSDLRGADRPSEWGGTRLAAAETLTLEVNDNHPATAPEDKSDVVRFGDTTVSRPLVETIVRASEATGVDPTYMMALADKESSFDTDVKSSASSAQGLFQFVTATWFEMIRDYGAKHGLAAEASSVKGQGSAIGIPDQAMRKRVLDLRNDPYVAGLMAGEMINRDRAVIESRLGRELKTPELYIAHFLGTASAGKFLSLSADQPERDAQQVFGRAARSNRSIFTQKSVGKRRSLTVAELHDRLQGMIDQRMNQFHSVAAIAAEESVLAAQDHDDYPMLDARLWLKDSAVLRADEPSIQ